ncbi:tRNA (uridine(54)-C5)-methyltransferase TrmA [Oceaniserpentilla sp. 4NH20-0058]|uniref:tRNA (uridine(54)-C5)-methyltransferase TrmA n=1 Tax=Oceaniserpentilla sp. 4NH20-0058 TaxID=3127660 RepID=UPI003105BCE2
MHQVVPEQYSTLLAEKQQLIEEQFTQFNVGDIQVFESEPLHFRQRAEFRIWHEGDECFHAMFAPGTKTDPIKITDFPIASKAICELMPKLITAINEQTILKHKLFQVEYLNTLSGEMLVTLIYHKQLDDQWIEVATALKQQFNIHVIGRARKMRLLLDQEYVMETLNVDDNALQYQQIEASFTQPNAKVNEKMLSWARACHQDAHSDLLELYCGNGNFSLALADQYRSVFATEISKTSINAANYAKQANGIDNVTFARVSAEEFTEHMNGTHLRKRLTGLGLEDANFETVLVDPPRAGLDKDSCQLISQYKNIIYISCNPDTLELNLQQLSATHKVTRFAMFDQFPYTHHIECGAFLQAK